MFRGHCMVDREWVGWGEGRMFLRGPHFLGLFTVWVGTLAQHVSDVDCQNWQSIHVKTVICKYVVVGPPAVTALQLKLHPLSVLL